MPRDEQHILRTPPRRPRHLRPTLRAVLLVACALAAGFVLAAPTATATPTSPRLLTDPPLSNLFLTRQSANLAPQTCLTGSNTRTFSETLDVPVPGLAAFSFDLTYDEAKVCVRISPGTAAAGMDCLIQDDANSFLRDVARISCIAPGPGGIPDTTTPAGRQLATVVVRPQPIVYSSLRPNDNNGALVLLIPDNCELHDLLGNPLPLAACDRAAVTLRYLQGDVGGPDCAVTTLDMQAIISRLGTRLGSLRYSPFYDVQPSPRGDGDIDIVDLQFVSGRYGSTCALPHPPQLPFVPTG